MTDDLATCAKCGALAPAPDTVSERKPCPSCGSLARKSNVDLSSSGVVALYDQERLRRKDHSKPSKDKLRLEVISGFDFSHATGKWSLKDRVIDRDNDRYFEHVIDPATGQTIHKCEESLKDHFGHGSAKNQKVEDDT